MRPGHLASAELVTGSALPLRCQVEARNIQPLAGRWREFWMLQPRGTRASALGVCKRARVVGELQAGSPEDVQGRALQTRQADVSMAESQQVSVRPA